MRRRKARVGVGVEALMESIERIPCLRYFTCEIVSLVPIPCFLTEIASANHERSQWFSVIAFWVSAAILISGSFKRW
ncbi:MAG TPA: hypothetical protein IGS53_16085 [Leptolyngbyaceae cyanobacterium M33_DOE_097]|uniref:Uncharacterized protein n=1 Tax=Oscillatoriales cyanobacterium SpSt-418 TaxID=2282169 RepID=A0A7C3KJ66_9CYAN|nr:hypothetical protein [Leptolyngbyaceae cyanobacterium M33_DOE_097]